MTQGCPLSIDDVEEYIASYSWLVDKYTAPQQLTPKHMCEHFEVSRATLSSKTTALMREGRIRAIYRHVNGGRTVMCYASGCVD